MKITNEQTKTLLQFVATSKPDEIDCDGCFDHMAEFVEYELLGSDIPEALQKVHRHIEQCPCCNDEHNALLEGLRAIEQA
jgi:hypothetical protein